MNDVIRHGIGEIADAVADLKPKLRGWLHAGTAPVALAAGIVLVLLSPTPATRVGSAVYAASALLLFTVSAVYHRGHWGPRTWALLKRWDHANIFVFIAGSYTPLTIILLRGSDRWLLLSVVWSGALLGVLFRIFWVTAPRWLYTPIYVALGWAAVFFYPGFEAGAHPFGALGIAILALVVLGGLFYTLGGIVYGFKRPDPWPRWFGFHEVFHSFTILAFISHYVSISMATYALR